MFPTFNKPYYDLSTTALISGDEHYIPDSSLTSSSVYEHGDHGPGCSRMVDVKPDGCHTGGWVRHEGDFNPWIQVTVNFISFKFMFMLWYRQIISYIRQQYSLCTANIVCAQYRA